MRIGLIFVSANGTAEKVTELLKKHFVNNGHIVKTINLGRAPYRGKMDSVIDSLNQYDMIGLGSPVYHMDTLGPMLDLLKRVKLHDFEHKLKAFVYLTYSGITTGKAFINTVKALNSSKIDIVGGFKVKAPHFHHKNDVFDIKEIDTFTKQFCDSLEEKEFAAIQSEKAKILFSPEKRRVNLLFPIVHVVGKLRELPIKIDKTKCKQCGKCERECPSVAITVEKTAKIDFSKCLHCYHCVIACPFHAITSPIHEINNMIKINKKIVGMEKPSNNIYI